MPTHTRGNLPPAQSVASASCTPPSCSATGTSTLMRGPFPALNVGKAPRGSTPRKPTMESIRDRRKGQGVGALSQPPPLGIKTPQFMSTIRYIPGVWVTGVKCCKGVYDGRHCFPSSVHHSERVEAREKGKKGEVYKVTKSIGALESSFREQDIEVIGNVPASYVTQKWTG